MRDKRLIFTEDFQLLPLQEAQCKATQGGLTFMAPSKEQSVESRKWWCHSGKPGVHQPHAKANITTDAMWITCTPDKTWWVGYFTFVADFMETHIIYISKHEKNISMKNNWESLHIKPDHKKTLKVSQKKGHTITKCHVVSWILKKKKHIIGKSDKILIKSVVLVLAMYLCSVIWVLTMIV